MLDFELKGIKSELIKLIPKKNLKKYENLIKKTENYIITRFLLEILSEEMEYDELQQELVDFMADKNAEKLTEDYIQNKKRKEQ